MRSARKNGQVIEQIEENIFERAGTDLLTEGERCVPGENVPPAIFIGWVDKMVPRNTRPWEWAQRIDH